MSLQREFTQKKKKKNLHLQSKHVWFIIFLYWGQKEIFRRISKLLKSEKEMAAQSMKY